MHVLDWLSARPRYVPILTGWALIAILAIVDTYAPAELHSSIFYLLPVVLVAWFAGSKHGVGISIGAVFATIIADYFSHVTYENPLIPLWNAFDLLVFNLAIALTLARLHQTIIDEKNFSRTDFLTKIANNQYYYEVTAVELDRAHRNNQPLSVAYVDVDNFKGVNDTKGHNAGDTLLHLIAAVMKTNLRPYDLPARLGGDEFGILFPDTDADEALNVTERLKTALDKMTADGKWPVSFSIGLTTCKGIDCSVDSLMLKADSLMYTAKTSGKNRIRQAVYDVNQKPAYPPAELP